MYEVILSESAEKFLKKLPNEAKIRIISTLERTRIRPEVHFERLVGEKLYKLRAGDYRIIADIQQGNLIILVIKIGHRKNIYK